MGTRVTNQTSQARLVLGNSNVTFYNSVNGARFKLRLKKFRSDRTSPKSDKVLKSDPVQFESCHSDLHSDGYLILPYLL